MKSFVELSGMLMCLMVFAVAVCVLCSWGRFWGENGFMRILR